MILETNGEVAVPIIFKIEKDFNCNLVFIMFLKGKKLLFLLFLFGAN